MEDDSEKDKCAWWSWAGGRISVSVKLFYGMEIIIV